MKTEQIVAIFKWGIALVLVAGGIVLMAMDKVNTEGFIALVVGGLAALGLGQVMQKKVGQ